MASIQEALYAALTADAAITAIVGDRIFPGEIPDDETPPPWVYYLVPNSKPLEQLADDEPIDVLSEVEFHALADTYANAKAIVDAITDILKGARVGVVKRSHWEETTEETTEDGYHHTVKLTVQWELAP